VRACWRHRASGVLSGGNGLRPGEDKKRIAGGGHHLGDYHINHRNAIAGNQPCGGRHDACKEKQGKDYAHAGLC